MGQQGARLTGGACLTAIGCACGSGLDRAINCGPEGCCGYPCSGYYVTCQEVVDSVVTLLREPPARPATLWLAGQFIDAGTLSPLGAEEAGELAAGALRGPVSLRSEGVASPLAPVGGRRPGAVTV
jgi:hypothetical protein